MAVVPLAFLLGSEGILRLGGYGYSPGFYRRGQLEGRAVWIENRDFGRRFFPPGLVRYAQPITLADPKPTNTLRVIVLGESAALGDPDLKFGLPRMLGALLRERFPGRRVEVINEAMVAINSHVILPIARDSVGRQADLWVIYMGNNEVIGPYGSASIFGARAPALSLVRVGLWLKTTRVGQFLEAAMYALARGGAPPREWSGMEMMADQKVAYNAPATTRVYRHFESNLAELLSIGARAGVPIVLCTVPTNVKDCAPFASLHRRGLSDDELRQWQAAYDAGAAAQREGRITNAMTAYERAAAIDSQFAELAFRQAQCHHLLGQDREAASWFRLARDRDALQFRADDRINETIRREAAAFGEQHVSLVDAERLFAEKSPQGLVGGDLFYEHVHLRPEGNYLLARAVAEAVTKSLGEEQGSNWLAQAECLDLLGLTDWNRYDALNTILDRVQSAPFTSQADHAAQVQTLLGQMTRYRPGTKPAQVRREAAQVAQLLKRYPDDPDLRRNLAGLLQSAGDLAGAEEQWRALIRLEPRSPLPLYNLARLLEDTGRPAEALALQLECLQLDPEYYLARYAAGALCLQLGRLPEAIQQLKLAVRRKPGSIEARLALGRAWTRTGQKSEADKQWQAVLKLDPNNQAARAERSLSIDH